MEESQARRQMLSAAIGELHRIRSTAVSEDDEILVDLLHHYQQWLEEANTVFAVRTPDAGNYEEHRRLESRLRAVERSTILRLRDQNKINDKSLRSLERELDLLDARNLPAHP